MTVSDLLINLLLTLPMLGILILIAVFPKEWIHINRAFLNGIPMPNQLREMKDLDVQSIRYICFLGIALLSCFDVVLVAITIWNSISSE